MTPCRTGRLLPALFALTLACGDKGGTDTAPTTATGSPTGTQTSGTGTPAGTPGGTHTGTPGGTPTGTTGSTPTGTVTSDVDGDGFTVAAGDCDDTDPTIHPAAIEHLGDAVDQDCDGAADHTPWGHEGTFVAAIPPVITANGLHTLVVGAGEIYTTPAGTPVTDGAMAFPLPLLGSGQPALQATRAQLHGMNGVDLPLGPRLDVLPVPDAVALAHGYSFDLLSSYTAHRQHDWSAVAGAYVSGELEWDTLDAFNPSGVDGALGTTGLPWVTVCGADTLTALWADGAPATTTMVSLSPNPLTPDGVDSGLCFFDGQPDDAAGTATVVSCAPGQPCASYTATMATDDLSPTQGPWTGEVLRDARAYEDRVVALDDQPGLRLYDGSFTRVLEEWTVHHADWGTRSSGTDHAIAFVGEPVVDDGLGPRLVLAYGALGSLTVQTLDTSAVGALGAATPTGVGVHLDADRLAIAFSGTTATDDVVAWAFYDWP